MKWEYETEGFDLSEAGYYLPDFWFPDASWFAEVKPNSDFSATDEAKMTALSEQRGKKGLDFWGVIRLIGTPATPKSVLAFGDETDEGARSVAYFVLRVIERAVPISEIDKAVQSARGARFEHGECG